MGSMPSFTDKDRDAAVSQVEKNTNIKYGLLALFSPTPPPDTPKKVAACLFKIKGDKPTEAAVAKPTFLNRDPNTIFISQYNYQSLSDLRSLESLPGVMYDIIRELDNAGNTADLGKVFDAIKHHMTLFKKSDMGVCILRFMIINDYFEIEENQSILRSFFHDIGKDRLREMMQILCAINIHKYKVITTLTTLCRYTPEEIDALLQ